MNKNIDVCGLGNALVDLQVEVIDTIIDDFKLNKGEMQLTDAVNQTNLLNSLSEYKQHKCSGGSAANTIISFSQFGGRGAYQTSLGNDNFGKFYSKEFTDLDISLSAPLLDKEPTGTCLVLITPDSERTMVTALGASAFFTKSDLNINLIQRSKWIYIEGYELTQEDSSDAMWEAVRIAKKCNTKIALTFSDVFITEVFHDNLKRIAENADLIFCNEAEAMAYSKKSNLNDALTFFDSNFNNYAITLGDKGSIIKFDNQKLNIPSYPAQPKDSTGAGDMFAGAFMYGMINFDNIEKAGHLASAASAKIVSQLGARMLDGFSDLKNKINKL